MIRERGAGVGGWVITGTVKPPHDTDISLQWHHNGHGSVSNHQPHYCLLNRLFRPRSKKTSKLRVTGLCAGIHRWSVNSPHKWPIARKMFPFDDVIMFSKILTKTLHEFPVDLMDDNQIEALKMYTEIKLIWNLSLFIKKWLQNSTLSGLRILRLTRPSFDH